MIFAFELINKNVSESGFSSGEVLLLEFDENIFSGEIFGRAFSFDFSPLIKFLPGLRLLIFILPPFIRIGFILLGVLF